MAVMAEPPLFMAKNKYIETPERLLELFSEYRDITKSDPIIKNDFAGKDAEEVFKKLERPLTMEGFECYVFEQGVCNYLGDYFSNKDNRYAEYATICSHIRRRIRKDQIEGGMAGIYNPSITQRLNGLVEKVDQQLKIESYDLTLNLK